MNISAFYKSHVRKLLERLYNWGFSEKVHTPLMIGECRSLLINQEGRNLTVDDYKKICCILIIYCSGVGFPP